MLIEHEDHSVSNHPWSATVSKYKQPELRKSVWQIVNSFGPYLGLWTLAYLSLSVSYWLTLALMVLATGFRVRIFIIQHDCGHRAFFKSQRANDAMGFVCSLFTWTPYVQWRRSHAMHHATSGNLDQRGHGDIDTLTIREYYALDRWARLKYRLYRNPILLFVIGAPLYFILFNRLTGSMPKSWKRERRSIYWTNLALAGVLFAAWATIGLTEFFLVELPSIALGATVGTWLFYVQHQYEDTYWRGKESWNFNEAAVQGSSYYKLPRVLQWFSGNIGFHHIHHLNSRIPNYNLQSCYEEEPHFRDVATLTLAESFRCANLKLWDEESLRCVTFGEAERLHKQQIKRADASLARRSGSVSSAKKRKKKHAQRRRAPVAAAGTQPRAKASRSRSR